MENPKYRKRSQLKAGIGLAYLPEYYCMEQNNKAGYGQGKVVKNGR